MILHNKWSFKNYNSLLSIMPCRQEALAALCPKNDIAVELG